MRIPQPTEVQCNVEQENAKQNYSFNLNIKLEWMKKKILLHNM